MTRLEEIEGVYRQRCARAERTLVSIIERDGFILAEMKAKNGDTLVDCTNAPLIGVGDYCVQGSITIDRFLSESARFGLIKHEIDRLLERCKEEMAKAQPAPTLTEGSSHDQIRV